MIFYEDLQFTKRLQFHEGLFDLVFVNTEFSLKLSKEAFQRLKNILPIFALHA